MVLLVMIATWNAAMVPLLGHVSGGPQWTFCRVSCLRRRTLSLRSSKLMFVMYMIQEDICLQQSKGGNEVAEVSAGPGVG